MATALLTTEITEITEYKDHDENDLQGLGQARRAGEIVAGGRKAPDRDAPEPRAPKRATE